MREHTGDDPVALGTALIFADAVYLSEALNLPVNQNEDDVDAELALLARESGIQDPYRFLCPVQDISRALSTLTVDSDHRSSMSIHSQETQSTSFTSAPSRTSRDQIYSPDRSPAQRVPPKLARTSLSVDKYDQAMEGQVPGSQQRHSTSTLSVAPSTLSSASSLQSRAPRRKRGSGLFAMFRKDSSSCTSRSHHGHHSKSRGDKLECGHSLSALAIRIHVQEALQSAARTVPNCCGKALPRTVLEEVLTKAETDLVLTGEMQSPDVGSPRDSGYCEDGMSSVDLPRPLGDTSTTPVTPNTPVQRSRHEAINIDSALANEAFKSFKVQQKEQFDRVAAFECNQRKALSAHYQCSLKWLTLQHETSKGDRMEQHATDLEHLEELQIIAEHDLRKAQSQETQNVATALKHMEAYCLGTNANHPEHAHAVSEEDFRKLDRQRTIQQNLPRKHENAINVLRARQERETKRRLRKQEEEFDQMDETHEKEKAKCEAEYTKEAGKLEGIIEVRRRRLLQRWDLRFEMWRRDWEEQHSTTLQTKLEHESWPLQKTETVTPISESSSLAQYVKAAA
ncbi:uncharacterized protein K460DRAFT_358972 [Cucurbitaria berberidis CBS 394.84]|uniref:Uncharacterized protein n=1 Tax=Cucurbitaria berberidis CBS 394.84 TaxID=1168544 RepID=A0A9P4GAS2_9PLEO|nr:uncharacterized protein K460DRAFT_358972 [Cucurbitaria berberidis CBS 394.84]KAF1842353.1 hypothetical protein K460DRAFT_358972 [Cucurbitaria berberidis CBS 394.84]